MGFLCFPVFGPAMDVLAVVKLLFDDHMHNRVEHADICSRAKLNHFFCKTAQTDPTWVHYYELATALGELFEIGRCNRVVLNRVRSDDDCNIGVLNLIECRRNSARANILDQRGYRTGMAKPRAVIDVVVKKALPNEFLEKICLFIGTFGRTKPRYSLAAMLITQPRQSTCGKRHRFIPARLAKELVPVVWVYIETLRRSVFAADKRFCQAVRVMNVVKSKAALHTKPALVGRPVNAFNIFDLAIFDLKRNLAANATKRTDTFCFAVKILAVALLLIVQHRRRHKRPSRASLNTFATSDT